MAGWWWWARRWIPSRSHRFSSLWEAEVLRMVLGNTDGFRGHAALCGAERGASDDRKISACKSGGGLRANDERQCGIPRGIDDVKLKARLFDADQLNRLIIRTLGFGGETMPQERRRTPRYPFVADTEVRDDASGTTVKTRTRELSLYGCYVDMDNPFPAVTPITIKINTA